MKIKYNNGVIEREIEVNRFTRILQNYWLKKSWKTENE